MYSETYSEYQADCSRCHKEVFEVIEYMDIENWDEECGVCPKCKKLFCGKCVKYDVKTDKTYCPECGGVLINFWRCDVYDLISVIEHNFQPFPSK